MPEEPAPPIVEEVPKHRPLLPFALGGAVLVALLLTVVSTTLYVVLGTITTDLSRPGYEDARNEVTTNKNDQIYDNTSPVTAEAIDAFLTEYNKRFQETSAYGNFTGTSLEDSELQLTP